MTKETGRSSPLGATLCPNGANFSVYSKHATKVELLLFDGVDDAQLRRVISIEPATNRTYHYWHIFVSGVKAGQIYGYRVSGAFDRPSGMCFDPATLRPDGHWVHFNAYASQAKPKAIDEIVFPSPTKVMETFGRLFGQPRILDLPIDQAGLKACIERHSSDPLTASRACVEQYKVRHCNDRRD